MEEAHPVRDLAREAHLVGDHHHRHVQLGGEGLHHVQDLADQLGVERRRRLVEEHHVGLHRERTRDGDPLLLTAREMDRVGVRLVGQSHLREDLAGHRAHGVRLEALHDHGALHHVLERRHVREEIELLEDHPGVGPQTPDLLPLAAGPMSSFEPDPRDLDHAVRRVLQEVDAPKERRLARSRPAEDHDDLAGVDLHVDALQDLVRPEVLVEVLDPDDGVAVGGAHRGGSGGAPRLRLGVGDLDRRPRRLRTPPPTAWRRWGVRCVGAPRS